MDLRNPFMYSPFVFPLCVIHILARSDRRIRTNFRRIPESTASDSVGTFTRRPVARRTLRFVIQELLKFQAFSGFQWDRFIELFYQHFVCKLNSAAPWTCRRIFGEDLVQPNGSTSAYGSRDRTNEELFSCSIKTEELEVRSEMQTLDGKRCCI